MRKRISLIALTGLASCFLSCSREASVEAAAAIALVEAVFIERTEVPDEVVGFGTVSFAKKVDVTATADAMIDALPYREGARIAKGAVAVRLTNPHIALARQSARAAASRAEAAVALAASRLREGRFSAEARIMELKKAEGDLAHARRELDETRRKLADQERLFAVGGLSEEAIREARFASFAHEYQAYRMELELAIDRIGLRDSDLVTAADPAPVSAEERVSRLIALSTESLAAAVLVAEAEAEAAAKEAASADLAFSDLTIISPVSGTVGVRYREEGERVKKEDALLTIIDTSELIAVFAVQENDSLRLRPGLPAEVRVDGAGLSVRGRIVFVSPMADAQSGAFSAKAAFTDESGLIKPGMFARVSVRIGDPKKVSIVRESAFIDRQQPSGSNEARVFEIVGGVLRERRLALGASTPRGWIVEEGIEPDAPIVDRPSYSLREGDRVSISR